VTPEAAVRLRRAVAERRGRLVELTRSLVQAPTTLGKEEPGQAIVAGELERLGFEVERIEPDAAAALRDPHGGYPALSYEGRTAVAGRLRGTGGGRSLHLSGHIDVVPVEADERWTHGPWAAEVADGRIWGRGAGDMKGGTAAYLVAVESLLEAAGAPAGDLLFSSVFEEENGGNGMRAVLAAGYDADGTLIAEPSALQLLHGGVGVIWLKLTARSAGAHAAYAEPEGAPLDRIAAVIAALRELERRLNDDPADAVFAAAHPHPFNLNLGEIHGGVWPSSVPAEVVLRGRLGFGRDREPAEVQALVRETIEREAPGVEIAFDGFRAHAYCHEPGGELGTLLASCHKALQGADAGPSVGTFTTDARYVEGECLCFGPIAGNIHGIDEWVDVESLEQTTATVALAAAEWLNHAT
jgi:acetylornithine deacetylase